MFITPQELYERLKPQQALTLLDTRSSDEFSAWSMYGSINIPLSNIERGISKLPKKTPIVSICNYGDEAHLATKLLRSRGLSAVTLKGGLKAWNAIYDVVQIMHKSSPIVVYQLKRLGKGCLGYIVVLPDMRSALIIDPTHHIKEYLAVLKKYKLKARAVLDTHIHADHVSGGPLLASKLHVPYLLPKKSDASIRHKPLEDTLPSLVGDVDLSIIATPGHTKESICFLLDQLYLFTGDTLFVDSIGKTDLDGDTKTQSRQLFQSITKLLTLPDFVQVFPAHTAQSMVPGPVRSATMRYLKLFNPITAVGSLESFASLAHDQATQTPSNQAVIKSMNKTGKRSKKDIDEIELGPNCCSRIIPEKK
jgi:glyoxylase-like metal-dependent hydrolase (beta-lactamase superfamily II)/rhodanese-related sulfurtransferase